jgi:hypothetical protein
VGRGEEGDRDGGVCAAFRRRDEMRRDREVQDNCYAYPAVISVILFLTNIITMILSLDIDSKSIESCFQPHLFLFFVF